MIIFKKLIFLLYFFAVNCSGKPTNENGSVENGIQILFLGMTGSGKSSTINMLLGNRVENELTKKTKELKPTKSVIEYTLRDEDHFVGFIDTPGVGSTIGALYEARVISTLRKYLMEKGSSLPPVILIFSKFDDNRAAGDNSNFVKMLKKFNELVDQVYSRQGDIRPQIIFVFTHYLGVTKREQRNPKAKISMFTNIIQNYTTFPTPIVTSIAENEAEDEELDLDEESGSYILLNRELYPQNLINKILDAVSSRSNASQIKSYKRIFEKRKELNFETKTRQAIVSADEIPEYLFPSDKFNITKNSIPKIEVTTNNSNNENLATENTENASKEVSTPNNSVGDDSTPNNSVDDVYTPNNSVGDDSTTKSSVEDDSTTKSSVEDDSTTKNSIDEVTTNNSTNQIITTEKPVNINILTTKTVKFFQKLNKCDKKDGVISSELEALENSLSEQNVTEFPKRGEEVTLFIQKLSLNENQIGILEKCFGVAIPTLNLEDSIVGYGYDILRNLPMSDTPFKTEELIHSSLGFKIPAWINSSVIKPEEELVIQNFFNKWEDFLNMRLNNLSLENAELGVTEKDYTPQFTVGNNIRETWVDEEIVKITSLREYRLFSWSLRELESFDFNEDFLETLSDLPKLDTFNKDSVNEWSSFFSIYGSHIVTFAYGGGSLETHVNIKRPDVEKLIVNGFIPIPEPSNNFSNHIRMPHLDKLKFNGGLDKYRKYSNLKDNSAVNLTYTIFGNWHQSLPINPIILETNLLLMPWSEVIRSKNLQLSEEMEKATKAYLTGTLKYKKMRATESTIAPIPETTTKIFTSPASTTVTTTEIPVTLSPEEFTSSTTKTQTLSPDSVKVENEVSEEMTDELFQSYIKGIREIVSTLTKTCNLTLTIPKLPQTVSNTSVRYGEARRSVYKNLEGLINVVNTSGSFCRNKYRYQNALVQLNRKIYTRKLPIEKLCEIYREMRFLFLNKIECNGFENSSEYLGSHIGYGYNIQYNLPLPIKRTPFESLKNYIQCDKEVFRDDKVTYTYKILRKGFNSNNYNQQQLKHLSPSEPTYNSVHFYGTFPSGVNPYYYDISAFDWLEEYTIFSANLSTEKPLMFSSDFQRRVEDLPVLNDAMAKRNCIEKLVAIHWKRFFNDYGTHIVTSSNVGGALKITPNSLMWSEHFQGLDEKSEDEKSRIIERIPKEGLEYFYLGGNSSELNRNELNENSLKAWRKSLHENPTLLQSGLQLTPIIELIKSSRSQLTATADAVMTSLYAGEIRTYCNGNEFSNNCYNERRGNYTRTFLGMCYLPEPYQCSIRHLGHFKCGQ